MTVKTAVSLDAGLFEQAETMSQRLNRLRTRAGQGGSIDLRQAAAAGIQGILAAYHVGIVSDCRRLRLAAVGQGGPGGLGGPELAHGV